jgi:hypothetical protein
MSADGTKMYLVLNVNKAATTTSKFSAAVKYVFHLNAAAAFGMTPTNTNIICTFDATQKVSCWAVSGGTTLDYVTGDASATAGLSSASGKMKVFTGLRDDPFFFNLTGFQTAAKTVHDAAVGGALPAPDNAGCIMVGAPTSTVLVNQLSHGGPTAGSSPPADDFKGLNVLSIVMAVDTAMVTSGGAKPIVGVWGSTNK